MLLSSTSGHRGSTALPTPSTEDIDPWGDTEQLAESSSTHSTITSRNLTSHSESSNPSNQLSTSNSLRRRQRLQTTSQSQSHSDSGGNSSSNPGHPLENGTTSRSSYGYGNSYDVSDDVSRPALRRLTSEMERQVAESSRSGSEGGGGSLRGSFDMLRMSSVESGNTGGGLFSAGEVEVLIHHVKDNESLPGIALLYGIDLAILRRTNKLWPSDPVHLRTHLYVPLEACKWNKASEALIRGPGEGQITLISKNLLLKGKGKEVDHRERGLMGIDIRRSEEVHANHNNNTSDLVDLGSPNVAFNISVPNEYDVWDEEPARNFMPSTNQVYDKVTTVRGVPLLADVGGEQGVQDDTDPTPRILDVVRIPSSQLRFFPRAQTRSSDITPRNSMDGDTQTAQPIIRHSKSHEGTVIQNNLRTLPPHLQPKPPIPVSLIPAPPKSKIVKLRPPQASIPKSSSNNSFTSRLSSLFDIPPPPFQQPFGNLPHPPTSSRHGRSGDSVTSPKISRRSSMTSSVGGRQPEVLLELHPRDSRGVGKVGGKGEAKKLD